MITKYYFWIAQLIVFVAFLLLKDKNWNVKDSIFFENKYLYAVVMASAFYVGINYNLEYQIFCNPVPWTYWILIPVGIWLVFFPVLKQFDSIKYLNSFLFGLSLFVLAYVLLFGSFTYVFLLLGVSVLGFLILLFSHQLNVRVGRFDFGWLNFYSIVFIFPAYLFILLIKEFKYFNKWLVALPIVLMLTIAIYSSIKINAIENIYVNDANRTAQFMELKKNPVDRYYLELFLGLHWKYHTQLAIVDGWRPPYHDPMVGFRRWFNFGDYRINYTAFIDLKREYAKVFPENETDFPCKCAKNMVWIN